MDKFKLLASVSRFLSQALRRDKAGRSLAQSLGLHDAQVLEQFEAGYANGSLLQAIPSKGDVRDSLQEIGLLDIEGRENQQGCLMLPVYDMHKNVTGFISIDSSGKETRLPDSLSSLGLNREALQEKTVIFAANALHVLLLSQAGYSNVVAVCVDPNDEERSLIKRFRPDKALILGDLPGLVRFLQKLEVPCLRLFLEFPASSKQIEQTIQAAQPISETLGPDAVAKVSEDLIRFEMGTRIYELRELSPGESDRLRVRLAAQQGPGRFHVDTLDLYAGRSRMSFARAAAPLFAVSESAIEGDLCLMIRKMEAIRAVRRNEAADSNAPYAMTADEEAEALEFLKSPDLLNQVVKDMEVLGYVGEEVNKKIGYLITISRKLSSPLCGVILSRAAAGKSRLLEILADLVSPEDLVSYTRITPQALYYAENRSLKNKLVVAGEDEGLAGSDYALRELISSKRISLAAPVKDPMTAKMKTVQYEVEGPISLLFSTTKSQIHYENATRCFTLSLDESSGQTGQIHAAQRVSRTLGALTGKAETGEIRRRHRNTQRLLEPLAVVNPFAPYLSFPAHSLEMRREHEKYLSLIEAIALLNQHKRERKKCLVNGQEIAYIEAAIDDIEEANKLMTEMLGTRADELSRPSRELLDLIRQMVIEKAKAFEMEPRAYRFNRRDIREHTGWSDNQIKAHVRQLEELQYLLVSPGERGRMYRYELAYEGAQKDEKRLPGLTDTAKLRSKVGKLGMVGNGWTGLNSHISKRKGVESWKVGQIPKKEQGALSRTGQGEAIHA